ncbi:hypothetical protein Tco_0461250 [Tanacetum coccineum]
MLDRTALNLCNNYTSVMLEMDNGENIMKFHQRRTISIWDRSQIYYGVKLEGAVQQGPRLKESNFDQLYAYLKQHEVHANENRIMMERFSQPNNDPLALVSDASVQQYPTQSSKSTEPSPSDNFQMDSGNGKVVVQDVRGRYNANNQGRPFQRNNARGNGVAGNHENVKAKATSRFRLIQGQDVLKWQAQESGAVLDEELSLFLAGEQVTNVDDDVDDSPENDLALNVDHVFEADECDAFDSDVDEDEYHEVQECNDEQHNYVVDSNADYMSNSNIIPYDQYVEDNEDHGVQSRLANKPDMVVNDSVTSELARYKELVGEYEKRAKFELTDRERKIDEQMRIIISDRNRKETSLKSELHSAQILLSSTVDHYKSKTEEVTLLKKDFKQKEDKIRKNFWTLKKLRDKIEDRLYKQCIHHTPVKLVPRILPTKSQVKINLYVLTQLFTEFDKTCKTRITPTGITEGERGFEQTKRCYLTEVIPFFKTLKEHFVGVQTALFKEVKEMEEIFDQMNNEVDKNTVDKQYLEADMSKVHDESKLISKLEGECLNLQLKYQHLQESFDNNKSHTVQEAPDFNSFFKIKNLEHQIQEKTHVTALIEQNDCVRVELEKVKQHYKELYDSIKITRAHTSEKTSTMLNEIESLKAQLRSKESCFTSDYVKPKVLAPGIHEMCVVNILNSVNATSTVKIVLNKGKQIWKPKGRLSDNSLYKTKRVWKATGKLFTDIGYQWRPTGKKLALGKLDCGYQWRPTGKKFALGEMCHLTKLSVKCCSKHMTGNRSKLMNFVEKFIGSVRFGNDHLGAIMGYGDYVMGDSVISRVYYVEGLGHNLFSVGQFCDSDLEVAFRKHTCFVRDIKGTYILKGSRSTNLYTISIDEMMKSSPPDCGCQILPIQNHRSPTVPKSENTKYGSSSYLHMGSEWSEWESRVLKEEYILVIMDDIQDSLGKVLEVIRMKTP